MNLGLFRETTKDLPDDTPIIVNTELCGDSLYTVIPERNAWGKWAVMVDVDE